MEFLLEEISLCGDQGKNKLIPFTSLILRTDDEIGATVSDVLGFIDFFYVQSANDESVDSHRDPVSEASRVHNVDWRFKNHAWAWLAKHPEVSIGKNREGNGLSLADIEARPGGMLTYSGYL